MLRIGDGLVLIPVQERLGRLCDAIAGALRDEGVSPAELLATLPEARRRVVARHYPGLVDRPATGRRSTR